MLNALETYTLVSAFEKRRVAPNFLRMRYFGEEIAYNSDKVIAEYMEENQKAAPFCIARHNGIPVLRGEYDITTYTNPLIAIKRSMTADDLERKGFGEALYSQLSPEQRQDALFMRDLRDLDGMITRREEIMCASIMLNNSVTAVEYADDLTVGRTDTINFYEGVSNPASLDITTDWDEDGADILGDISAAVEMKVSEGQNVSDLIVSPAVARIIMNNDSVQKLLDNRRITLGEIEPRLLNADGTTVASGVTLYGVLNIDGYTVNIISYNAVYKDENNDVKKYIPEDYAILAHTDAGIMTYARVGEVEQSDGRWHYYAAARVPKYLSDAQNNIRQIKLSSRPLPLVREPNPFISMKVLNND